MHSNSFWANFDWKCVFWQKLEISITSPLWLCEVRWRPPSEKCKWVAERGPAADLQLLASVLRSSWTEERFVLNFDHFPWGPPSWFTELQWSEFPTLRKPKTLNVHIRKKLVQTHEITVQITKNYGIVNLETKTVLKKNLLLDLWIIANFRVIKIRSFQFFGSETSNSLQKWMKRHRSHRLVGHIHVSRFWNFPGHRRARKISGRN